MLRQTGIIGRTTRGRGDGAGLTTLWRMRRQAIEDWRALALSHIGLSIVPRGSTNYLPVFLRGPAR